ncbi:porin family protein [Sphingobacterium sp. CZ-2]|uniref:porin family protein n=1 Tax=Sphingobacterium sp. CZ-2 TaxID=2557994 RepID=UPI00106FC13E|nr:porin family protein [Sphingobacterium sp. CZ-2]QBR12803.1 PorT family protein [Sphingobacterium sp. CZ-2]
MRKLFLITLVSCISTAAMAQVSYGLKGGVNLGKFSEAFSDELKDYEKMNPSFYVTGFADIPVAPQFSIQPGLSLQGKGAKYEGEVNGTSGKITVNIMSLEIPVNAVYYIPAGTGNVFLGAGPYVGYALSGTYKSVVSGNDDASVEEDIDFSGDDKEANAFEAGLNFMAGYKLSNGFLINAGYGLGLTKIAADDDAPNYKNRVLSFGIGFQF